MFIVLFIDKVKKVKVSVLTKLMLVECERLVVNEETILLED